MTGVGSGLRRNLRIDVIIQFGVVDAAWLGVPGAPLRGTCKGVCPPFLYPHDQLQPTPTRHPRRRGGPMQPRSDEHPTPAQTLCFLTKSHPGQTTTRLAVRSDKVMSAPPSAQVTRGSLRHDLLFSVG